MANMIPKKLFFFIASFCIPFTLVPSNVQAEASLFQNKAEKIHVNNRILATVNGKPISVLDVMKKMDMIFYRNFPEYAGSTPARFQFYEANWEDVLRELIDKELVLADAEEKKIPLSNGDVRQEMEEAFGPDIIHNLDKAGITYDEAWNSIKGDILIKRMLYYRVNSKAQTMLTPQALKEEYEKYAKENVRSAEWNYYMISVRDGNEEQGAKTADFLYRQLSENPLPVEHVEEQLKTWLVNNTSQVNISAKFSHRDQEISDENQKILAQLTPGVYSKPVAQKSRATNSNVYRLFFLDSMQEGGIPAFDDVKDKLKNHLLDQAINAETIQYLEKLRQQYGLDKAPIRRNVTEDFQPFILIH